MPEVREMPHLAERRDAHHVELSRHPGVHEAIRVFYGRTSVSIPPEIIDDELLDTIVLVYKELKDWKLVGEYCKIHTSYDEKVQARAVLMNLARLRRENGGRYPWENQQKQ